MELLATVALAALLLRAALGTGYATLHVAVIALGLGCLLLSNLWLHILDLAPARYYALYAPAPRSRYLAALANLVVLGAALAPLVTPRTEHDGRLSYIAALLRAAALGVVLGLVFFALLRSALDQGQWLRRLSRTLLGAANRTRRARRLLGVALAFGAATAVLTAVGRSTLDVMATTLGIAGIVPLGFVIVRTGWLLLAGHPAAASCATLKRPGHSRSPSDARRANARVVWLIFDELDQGIAFDRRPSDVALPNFDALVEHSVSCTSAWPPAHCTELSMPALLSELPVVGTWPWSPTELRILTRGADTLVRWSEQETIFSRAGRLGVRSALVGWYHPYPRIIGDHVARCSWVEDPERPFAVRPHFAGAFVDHLLQPFESIPLFRVGASLTSRKAAEQHTRVRDEALHLTSAADFDLVALHWPIPHGPFFYDRTRRDHSGANRAPYGYLDNLVLADEMLGLVRAELERSRVGERTVLIVTSDHWWRISPQLDGVLDQRVPFIVKFPDETARVQWHEHFETVHTGELILELLGGRVSSASDLQAWLGTRVSAVDPRSLLRQP